MIQSRFEKDIEFMLDTGEAQVSLISYLLTKYLFLFCGAISEEIPPPTKLNSQKSYVN